MVLVSTDVSDESISSIIRVERIRELGTVSGSLQFTSFAS
jgi:hypothetical protein